MPTREATNYMATIKLYEPINDKEMYQRMGPSTKNERFTVCTK